MVSVLEVKNKMLEKMAKMDLDNMSLMDAGQYAMLLRTLSEINDKDYMAELLKTLQETVRTNPSESLIPVCLGMAAGGE